MKKEFAKCIPGPMLMISIIVLDEIGSLGLGVWGRTAVFVPLFIGVYASARLWR